MKCNQFEIPNLKPYDFHKHANKKVPVISEAGVKQLVIKVPYVNIIFTNALEPSIDRNIQATQQAQDLFDSFNTVKEFYEENSYGTFYFSLVLKTVFLPNDSTWRGNAWHPTRYASDTGLLMNKDDFPREDSYTGYAKLVIKDSNRPDAKNFRNYNAMAERNFAAAALQAIEQQSSNFSWDSQRSFDEWLDYGIPKGNTSAKIVFGSKALNARGGGVRDFKTYFGENEVGLRLPLTIGGRTLSQYIFMQSGTDRDPYLLAHELGHTLGFGEELYSRQNSTGFLGGLSIMGHDSFGSHFEAYNKFRLLWTDPEIITPTKATIHRNLSPVTVSPKNTLLIRPDSVAYPDEFFMVEVRHSSALNWNGESIQFDQELKENQQEGVCIYHINTLGNTKENPKIDLEGDGVVTGSDLKVFNTTTNSLFSSSDSTFYDDTRTGLRIEVLEENNLKYKLRISWERPKAEADFNWLQQHNRLSRVKSYKNWRKTWHTILPGNFSQGNYTDLLFYDKSNGEAKFYLTESSGDIRKIGDTHKNWRKSWHIMVSGNFNGSSLSDLLFYDKLKGEAEFYSTSGNGDIRRIGKTLKGWRKTWDMIIPGDFGGNGYSDLLLYDRKKGEAEFYTVMPGGNLVRMGGTHRNWRKSWYKIIPGKFGRGNKTYLLFYDRKAGEAEYHYCYGFGRMRQLGSTHKNWRKTWKSITAYQNTPQENSSLLFYDSWAAEIETYTINNNGGMSFAKRFIHQRKSWDKIIAGKFNGAFNFYSGFLFYQK